MTIAERISNLRIELGYSQEDLAQKCGWSSRSSISQIESSGDDISLKKIKKIAPALDTTVGFLLGWDESDSSPVSVFIDDRNTDICKRDYSALRRADHQDTKSIHNKCENGKIGTVIFRSDENEKEIITKMLEKLNVEDLKELDAYINYLIVKKTNENKI